MGNAVQEACGGLRGRISRSEASRATVAGVSRAKGVDRKAIGERIRARRESLTIQQVDLADRIGVRPPTMWRYEKGDMLPGPVAIQRLSEELQVSSSWILHGTDDTRVERDDAFPELLAYRDDMERAGTPIAPEHWEKLRLWRRATGPAEREEIIGYHRGMIAAAARRALERPLIEAEIETDRGQRPLPPIKRRR